MRVVQGVSHQLNWWQRRPTSTTNITGFFMSVAIQLYEGIHIARLAIYPSQIACLSLFGLSYL